MSYAAYHKMHFVLFVLRHHLSAENYLWQESVMCTRDLIVMLDTRFHHTQYFHS